MRRYLALVVLVISAGACSGTSESEGGSGGTAQGGSNQAGTKGYAGNATGGSVSSGGGGSVDPRCPNRHPSGTCDADDAGLTCQYDQYTGCLCYSSSGIYGYCQQVDVNCQFMASAGTGGSAGAEAGGSGGTAAGGETPGGTDSGGVGGFQAKIAAPPPRELCTCDAGNWICSISYF